MKNVSHFVIKKISSEAHNLTNRFQTTIAPKLVYLFGFMSGTLVGVISDTSSIRTKPEVNLRGLGASHDPEGDVKTCFLFNFAPEMGYLLCVIDRYHSDYIIKKENMQLNCMILMTVRM